MSSDETVPCTCTCHELGLAQACSLCDERHWRSGEYDSAPEDGCGDCTPEGNHPCHAGCRP